MRLVIMRHAEAASGEPDELRSLTEEGRRSRVRSVTDSVRRASGEPPFPAAGFFVLDLKM
jgi:phosphohistidine phosphatase SixA